MMEEKLLTCLKWLMEVLVYGGRSLTKFRQRMGSYIIDNND